MKITAIENKPLDGIKSVKIEGLQNCEVEFKGYNSNLEFYKGFTQDGQKVCVYARCGVVKEVRIDGCSVDLDKCNFTRCGFDHERDETKEIEQRIEILQSYIDNSKPIKNTEFSVGRSYKRRRNSRVAGLHQTRINEHQSELSTLKKRLSA
jgi:hypothetical protein